MNKKSELYQSLEDNKMENLSKFSSDSLIFQILSLALPVFFQKTKIKAQLSVSVAEDKVSIIINYGFIPRAPTEEEFNILLTEIKRAESVVYSNSILEQASQFDSMSQLLFQHRENISQQIRLSKQENEQLI